MDPLTTVTHLHYLGLFGLLILGGLGFPFPEDITLVIAGLLVSKDIIQEIPTFLVLYSGLLIADLMLYSLGRKYGRKLIKRKPFTMIITRKRLSVFEQRFRQRSGLYLMVGRHLVGFRVHLFIIAGIMRIPLVKFLVADAISAIFSIAIWGGIGYVAGYKFLSFRGRFTLIEHKIILPLIGLGLLLGAIYLLINYFLTGKR